MSATEREHVMPPRPLMPWTMALCAGVCMGCALVLNVTAEPAVVKELDRQYTLNEQIMRTKVIRPDLHH